MKVFQVGRRKDNIETPEPSKVPDLSFISFDTRAGYHS